MVVWVILSHKFIGSPPSLLPPSPLPKHGKDDGLDGHKLANRVDGFQQLLGAPVEVDEAVESAALGGAVQNAQVDPGIAGAEGALDVNVTELGNPVQCVCVCVCVRVRVFFGKTKSQSKRKHISFLKTNRAITVRRILTITY